MSLAADVGRLDERIGGVAARRGDALYEELRPSRFPNLEVPWDPEVVVHPTDPADVVEAVAFAAERGLGVAVRAGGVGWAGAKPGTVLIDLRGLDAVSIDPERRVVRVGGGAIWRDLSRELAAFGFAAAAPQFPRLGVAGHVLGGGHGWLSARLGWASDTLRAVELVSADGRLLRADAEREPDLFWAMRGAGHNFGVVVALELELIALEEVDFGLVWFDPERTAEALEFFREWIPGVPDELTTIVSVGHPPQRWNGPDELRGHGAVHVIACHCGDAVQAERDLAPLRNHPAAVADDVRRMPWAELAVGNDVFASGVHRRSRMHYVPDLSDEVIAISDRRGRDLAPLSFMSTHYYGGALRRVDEDATAMSHRDKPWNYMVSTTWASGDDGEPLRHWQDDYLAEIADHAEDAYYVNYLFDEPDHVAAAYSPRTWKRLRALKRAWDPQNLFSSNQNIPPG